MAVVCEIDEQYGGAPGTAQVNIGNLNFGSISSYEIVVATYPIYVDDNSYEKWIKMSLTSINVFADNFKCWKSAGAYVTAEGIDTNLRESGWVDSVYVSPIATESTLAQQVMPVAEPSGQNVGYSGDLVTQMVGDDDTDYIIMQLQTGATTPTGAVNQKTFTFQWDEA